MSDTGDSAKFKCSSGETINSSNDDSTMLGATSTISAHSGASGEMKKAAAQLIERYYFQLREGCGSPSCNNPHCASSGQIGPLTNDEAAGKALQLLTQRAKLCKNSDNLDQIDSNSKKSNLTDICSYNKNSKVTSFNFGESINFKDSNNSNSISSISSENLCGLTEEKLRNTISLCTETNNYAALRILLRSAFSNEAVLRYSFLVSKKRSNSDKISDENKNIDSEIESLDIREEVMSKEDIRSSECDLDKDIDSLEEDADLAGKSKEELRSTECDLDKDIDCLEDSASTIDNEMLDIDDKKLLKDLIEEEKIEDIHLFPVVDTDSLRRAYHCLFQCPEYEFNGTFLDAIRQLLKDSLSIHLQKSPHLFTTELSFTNVFIILLENPILTSTEFTDEVLGDLCRVMSLLSIKHQATIVRHLASKWEPQRLHKFLETLHQLITIRLLLADFSKDYSINDEDTITSATTVMRIMHFACIYGGELDYPLLASLPPSDPLISSLHQDNFLGLGKDNLSRPPPWDVLGEELGVHSLDARKPLVPLEEFYDEFLSDQLEMDKDFAYYKSENPTKFSFLNFPYILTPATKALGLYYDNRIRMYSERRMSIYQTIMEGTPTNPYLRLRIRRDHIIDDALVELELVALENPGDLKKQLVVEFEGEQGIDEGGVSKEFFQLITEQIFNPDYAMFCLNKETETFWFNPTSFESDAQFTLVGVVLGLAIYNNAILDLHFPPVMYKKLCGKPGSFYDLKDWNTTLYRSLLDLLNYTGDDMEDVFLQSFRVGYQDIFGASLTHDLRPGGENISVKQENKQEFVNLYADFLLNKSVERQFAAFRRGFAMVTDDSPLQHLFRPQELELLVCGSQHYDFAELRKSTDYDGYTLNTQIICWFWELIDEMSNEEKKQLLQFTTGSARVPVGGLARLKLIIARHGPDTERLPTAHTCFNVLLLPEYSSKEKLKERLLKAIKYAQGFGML